MRIKRKDPVIYQSDVHFFQKGEEEDEDGEGEGGAPPQKAGAEAVKKSKPLYLKDVLARQAGYSLFLVSFFICSKSNSSSHTLLPHLTYNANVPHTHAPHTQYPSCAPQALEHGAELPSDDEEDEAGRQREDSRAPKAYDAEQEGLRKAFISAVDEEEEEGAAGEADDVFGGAVRRDLPEADGEEDGDAGGPVKKKKERKKGRGKVVVDKKLENVSLTPVSHSTPNYLIPFPPSYSPPTHHHTHAHNRLPTACRGVFCGWHRLDGPVSAQVHPEQRLDR